MPHYYIPEDINIRHQLISNLHIVISHQQCCVKISSHACDWFAWNWYDSALFSWNIFNWFKEMAVNMEWTSYWDILIYVPCILYGL